MKSLLLRSIWMPALIAGCFAGCGGPAEKPAGEPTQAAAPAPEAAAAATTAPAPSAAAGGGIAGKVVFEGPAPKRASLETEGDPKCHAMHADAPLLSDREVVGADGGVQWAFAYPVPFALPASGGTL